MRDGDRWRKGVLRRRARGEERGRRQVAALGSVLERFDGLAVPSQLRKQRSEVERPVCVATRVCPSVGRLGTDDVSTLVA
jgi:hypothetical protein